MTPHTICRPPSNPVESLEGFEHVPQKVSMSEQQVGKPLPAAVAAAWERVERARHPQRPYPMDLIGRIFTDFSEIHGDRRFGDDEAVACGMARLAMLYGTSAEVLVIGIRKGGTTKEKVRRNFGMPNPEGYP